MISWCTWGAVNLAWTVEYAVQSGHAQIVPFEWFLPLTGLRAAESSVESCVFGVVAVVSSFVLTALGLAVVVSGFRISRFT